MRLVRGSGLFTPSILIVVSFSLVAVDAQAQACPQALSNVIGGTDTRCFLPVEIAQGPAFGGGSATTYTFAGKAQFAVGLGGTGGPVRIGPVFGALFDGSSWTAAAGAGVDFRIVRFGLPHWGLFAGGEYLLDRSDVNDPEQWSLSLLANLGLLRITGTFVRQSQLERSAVQLELGTDLQILIPLLRPGGDPDPLGATGRPR